MSTVWNDLLKRPARRNLSVWFDRNHVEQAGYDPRAAAPNRSYFQVRLAEMCLRYERDLWRGFLPATLFLCEFRYQQAQVRVPFFVSNRLLAGLELSGELGKAPIQFRDTRVVGPVPYLGDEVAILVALFRIQTADWRKSLFSMVEKLLGAVNGGGVAQYAAIADKLSDEILECLGMREVECLLAERRAYGSDGVAPVPLMDGYLALLNCAEGAVPAGALKVVDGQLRDLRSGKPMPFTDCDYCLVRLERFDARNDYTTLAFHKTWEKAREQLVRGVPVEAKRLLDECNAQIFHSPDLTEEHKYQLMQIYFTNFKRDEALFAALANAKRGPAAAEATRGAGDASGPALVGKMRARAVEYRAPQSGLEGLRQIEREWKAIVPPVPDEVLHTLDKSRFGEQFRLDDAEIARQLQVLGKSPVPMARDPSALVRTLSSAMLA
jgi:hypothetical protein